MRKVKTASFSDTILFACVDRESSRSNTTSTLAVLEQRTTHLLTNALLVFSLASFVYLGTISMREEGGRPMEDLSILEHLRRLLANIPSGAEQGSRPPRSTTPEPRPSQSSSTTNWLGLVETFGENLLITAASFAAIVQGLDVIERRWREHQAKRQQQDSPPASPSSQKTLVSDSEIIEIRLVMDDGSHHMFKRWISDPDTLRTYIDAFSDPTSKVKPLQVVFMKRKGRALVVNVTEGGKDNRQLNVVLSYLEADPQP
jgi:hypothetical protein